MSNTPPDNSLDSDAPLEHPFANLKAGDRITSPECRERHVIPLLPEDWNDRVIFQHDSPIVQKPLLEQISIDKYMSSLVAECFPSLLDNPVPDGVDLDALKAEGHYWFPAYQVPTSIEMDDGSWREMKAYCADLDIASLYPICHYIPSLLARLANKLRRMYMNRNTHRRILPNCNVRNKAFVARVEQRNRVAIKANTLNIVYRFRGGQDVQPFN